MSFFFTAQSFNDFDIYIKAVKTWDLEFIQLGDGPFQSDILLFGDEDIQFGEVQYNKLLLQNGSAPEGGYTFAIHHENSAPFLWRYKEFVFNSIIVFPDNRELHGVSQPGHHPITLTISESWLEQTAQDLGLPTPHNFISKGDIYLCAPNLMFDVQQHLTSVCRLMRATQGRYHGYFMNYVKKMQITSELLLAIANAKSLKPKKRNFRNRIAIVKRVLEYVKSNNLSPKSIQYLCKVANVDERTLRNIFYEQFSLSPKKIITSYRLNAVRRLLLDSDLSQVKVSDVANTYGFWHMGQFAKDYYRQFGELPSETLTR